LKTDIQQTINRLRRAADDATKLFPVQKWEKVGGPGPEQVLQTSLGGFQGIVWESGKILDLRCNLTVPEQVEGVRLAGEPLEALLFSLYPTRLSWNLQPPVFEEEGAPVAAGPALVTVIPYLKKGDNGNLHLQIKIPANQTTQWFNLRFLTPSLRSRFELLDTAWAEFALAEAMAVSKEEQESVREAADLVPKDLTIFNEIHLRQVEERLNFLMEKVHQLSVHVIGHSHIDMNWLWTWPDTTNVILRDFKSVLDIMDDYPELTFTHSQPATYEVVRQHTPELFARMLERIRQGRWEPATMTWVEGDENMTSGEALARQLLEGVSYSREILGYEPTTFLAPDTFGHPGNLPQLAASAGAIRYYHHRCNPGAANPWPAYWWEGVDGTRLLVISTPTYNGEIRARDLAEAALRALKHGQKQSLHFHGVGDHGGGPARHNLDSLRRFQRRPLLPSARCSTLVAYTDELLEAGVSLPVQRGELNTIFEGCYTTHADIKRYNRAGENLLCTADTLSVLSGIETRSTLGEAWRKVLFNQFHDLLDGSAIHESYDKGAADFEEVGSAARAVTEEALKVFSVGYEAGSMAVTNPLSWERSGWVSIPGMMGEGCIRLISNIGYQTVGQYSSEGLGFVARVPAFGTVSYSLGEACEADSTLMITPASAPTAGIDLSEKDVGEQPYYLVDTPFFNVYLRRDSGILTSFIDKRVQRELVHFGMRHASDYFDTARPDLALNVFQLLEERPHPMSAWHMDEINAEHSLIHGARTLIVESGAARIVLEVRHDLRASKIIQQIIFYRDLPQVDFKTNIDWREPGNSEKGIPNLKIAFTANLTEAEAWFETPFAAIKRPGDGQEVPALRWADVGGPEYGMALINDSKYGYDILGTRLRMSLVRSAYEPDAIADLGWHEINFRFLPHPGDWRAAGVVQSALGFNQPLLAREVTESVPESSKHMFWQPELAGNASVVLTGLKNAKKGVGMVLRMCESSGYSSKAEVHGIPEKAQVFETNILEDKLQKIPVVLGCIHLAFNPWQVKTILVE
jgi:alpha-mannosidase